MSTHLTDEEALSVADGQPVSEAALVHAAECEDCASRVADHALAAYSIQLELRALASATSDGRLQELAGARTPPRATKPLVVGVLVAIGASIPLMPSALRTIAAVLTARQTHVKALGALVRELWKAVENPVGSLAMTVVFLAVGALVAVRATRNLTKNEQGVR